MPTKWYELPVVTIKDESPTVKRYWIDLAQETIDFKPGQFITIDLPIGEKRLERWRSYSIANTPGDSLLELCIGYVPKGPASEYFFGEVAVGTQLKFKGPAGMFCLPSHLDQDIVMVCTGTGIVPFRSMLLSIMAQQVEPKKIHLIYGTRYSTNILYKEEFEQLAKENPWFTYDISLSKEKYNGHQGYVHDFYMDQYNGRSAQTDTLFYLCGWSNMIDEATDNLQNKLGFSKNQIISELYG